MNRPDESLPAVSVPRSWTSMTGQSVKLNSMWMMADQLVRQALALGFSIWIARQYGPAGFGSLSFAMALCALFGVLAMLGLNRIVVRELAHPDSERTAEEILGVAITLRFTVGLLAASAAIVTGYIIDRAALAIVAVLCIAFLATPFDTIDLYFQALLKSRIVAYARIGATLVSSCLKAYLLFRGSELWIIAGAFVFDAVCSAVSLYWVLRRTGFKLRIGLGDLQLARALLRESAPEILAGFCALAFMRTDQLMLQIMRGPAEVGIMAVSTRMAEAWYFIPASIVASAYPVIIKLTQSDPVLARERQQTLYRNLVSLAVVAGIAVTLLAEFVVPMVYGPDFGPAARVLVIQTWAGVFMSLGIASGTWLMAHRLGRFNLYRTFAGAVLNVLLNLAFIPAYGATGAAWATLGAFAFAYFGIDFLIPGMRSMGRQKARALVLR